MKRTSTRWILLPILGVVLSAAAAPGGLIFQFERYNDTYTGLVSEFAPIEAGLITIRLSSDDHDLTVFANRLELDPIEGGLHRALVWARFEGRGQLAGEIQLGLLPAKFEDEVTLPEQERSIEAKVRIGPDPAGYLVTLEELPETLEVEIESKLVAQMVGLCDRMAPLLGGGVACAQIDRLLTHPDLPLPKPGTEFVVRRDLLTEGERGELDGYLGPTAQAMR